MKCPACQSTSLKTTDSRKLIKNNATKRRKQCTKCLHRFSTLESIDLCIPKESAKPTYSVSKIKEVVAGYYGFPVTSLEGEKKSDPESVAKYVSYYISHMLGGKSASIIAKYHHSKHTNSIYHGLKRAKDLININEIIKNDIDFIIKIIKTA